MADLSIKQLKVIAKAFVGTAGLPKDKNKWPGYYKRRLAICNSCPYNTKNINICDLSLIQKVGKATGKYQCSICSCYVKQKCFAKSEICSRYEIGDPPSWEEEGEYKMNNEVALVKLGDVFIESKAVGESAMAVDASGMFAVYSLGTIDDARADEIYTFKAWSALEKKFYIAFIASCGCTNLKIVMNPDRSHSVSFKINYAGMQNEVEHIKNITIKYNPDETEPTYLPNFSREVVVKIKFTLNLKK